jgi:pyridoxal phosphate enzyme (YggS family)
MDSISNGPGQNVTQITDHLARVKRRVESALREAGRTPDAATILAVSKGHPAAAIEAAYRAGQRHFGENFVQEALAKMNRVDHSDIEWHFIGHVQSNKTRDIAERFDWVHTVDRLKIASRLNQQRRRHAVPLQVCIQVNQAAEPQKGGVAESGVEALARTIMELPRLRLRGLMTIPPLLAEPSECEALFARLRRLKERLTAEGIPLDTLSMGMSADLEVAVQQGSTIVRVGTAIFGPRPGVARH